MQETAMTRNDYIRMTVESGIAPLELRFFPILGCESGYPYAYRTKTLIHSVMVGDLPESEYLYVSDERSCGEELLRHNIQHAINAAAEFAKRERNVSYLSVHCPAELVEKCDLYRLVSGVLQKNPDADPTKICLEFPASLMERNTEKARTAILDMKLLKVRTALVGCGTEDFPISKLLTIPTDVVILDPTATAWAGSRNKPQLFTSLVSFIKSMFINVVAEGTEEQRKLMRGSDCDGFLVQGDESLSLDEALTQKEGDE